MAICRFATEHGFSTDDLSWLFKTGAPGTADKKRALGAWKAIASALPHRTASSVWSAGTRILHPDNYKVRTVAFSRLRDRIVWPGSVLPSCNDGCRCSTHDADRPYAHSLVANHPDYVQQAASASSGSGIRRQCEGAFRSVPFGKCAVASTPLVVLKD